MVYKIFLKMHSVSCTNTHHDVTDLVNHGMVKNKKNMNILKTECNFFYKIKKILTCASDDTLLEVIVLMSNVQRFLLNQMAN